MNHWLTIVGIGEDGLDGLGAAARRAIATADTLLGGARHLGLVPDRIGQARLTWPVPFDEAVGLVLSHRGRSLCILASGDPMFYGVGATLARHLPPGEWRILPAPSAFSLAAARLGWALQECDTLTVHGRPMAAILPFVVPGARLLILSEDGTSPARISRLLTECGYGTSQVTVLERLGGPRERILRSRALEGDDRCDDLNVVAVECLPDLPPAGWSRLAGLPDEAFRHDGQLTKRDVRAATLARLAPRPGELLWDVGAGCGSIGIEWMRAHPRLAAIAIEANPARRALIEVNREALGVPGLTIIAGTAPAALADLPEPDAVFIGGGVTTPDLVETCWQALRPGGRLVANAVTVQGEAQLVACRDRMGGSLSRLAVSEALPLGRFDGWNSAMPVTLWATVKPVAIT